MERKNLTQKTETNRGKKSNLIKMRHTHTKKKKNFKKEKTKYN